ncbi:hypothetical protein [Agrobacterium arsenijevicii]|uniref:hypothetical protein n=1 Tax=Agrobacterium arsenijevicii TaxID=1585697 RepID=UPI000AFE5602
MAFSSSQRSVAHDRPLSHMCRIGRAVPDVTCRTRLRVGEKVHLAYAEKGGKAIVSHLVPQK